jgi:hypothetical protein
MKISKTIKCISAGVILATFVSCSHKSELPLHLYEGLWKMETNEGSIFEEWDKVSDSLFTGIGYAVKDGDTILLETLTLKYADGKLCYAPVVQNQNAGQEVLFPLKEYASAENKFVFENITHDFPQRIIYQFADEKNLNVRIEGEVDGKMESSDFTYKKQ